ncbi:hypothetical protein ARMSODRAFT_958880 [Armillaria solidipes]|uniref:Uncharacterized protein n=1 Tax=Armillaria solidipes TaxID=1076256 RepID=A0A2H3BXT5_9AGAR|nr:hypothetical protein ARMSODRAFT_958880 [Armillaria solidipes]
MRAYDVRYSKLFHRSSLDMYELRNRLFPNQSSQLARSVKQWKLIALMTVALCALGTSSILTIKPFSHPRF